MEAQIIRYGDYQAYLHLIQYISTKENITQEHFRRFVCTDKEFILVVLDADGHLCMTAKINYLFKFSKQMSYDMLIQDIIYDPNHTLSVIEAYDKIFQYCLDHERVMGFQVDKRMAMVNHFLYAHELIFKRHGILFTE